MRLGVASIVALAVVATLGAELVRADEIAVKIPTRPGVTETVAVQIPDHVQAAAILFPGGDGLIGVSEGAGRRIKREGNFLIRSRDKFYAAGIATISLDVPSDQSDGISGGFRLGAEHAEDVAAVLAWVRAKTKVPVWLIGTSMGSISAANVAARLGNKIDGLVVTSSVTVPFKRDPSAGSGVLSIDLDKITVPALVMDHVNDACQVSPPENAAVIAKQLTKSPRVAVKLIEGGNSPKSGPCEAFSYHGYLGVEDKAVAAIAAFILAP